jgi:membrane-bound serine protease (ClpP class)
VEVVKASGLLDGVLVDFIEKRIAAAAADGLTAVVIQLNSRGATVSDERIVELARAMRRSTVPVAVWVGPSGAQARGAAAQLVAAAAPGGLAAGAQLGEAGRQILPAAEFGSLWGPLANRLEGGFVRNNNADRATLKALGLVDAAVLVDFVGDLEGVAVRDATAANGSTRRQPNADVRFTSLTLAGQLGHTVASPSVAYLLFVIGLGLIIFELYTAGIGIAGVVGAICLALGCYGLAALPVRWWAVAVLVAAFVAFAIDVQTGVPRFWTGFGLLLFLLGTVLLFKRFNPSWITWLAAVVGAVLTFVSGMPAMVRTRFSTPTIGREWMIGELGLAISGINPDGTVSVRSARWPARTNRATPISAGNRVRVVGIEGVVLEVEPETGGAKDYRERRREDGTPREGARDS